jgi:hypothetical protein
MAFHLSTEYLVDTTVGACDDADIALDLDNIDAAIEEVRVAINEAHATVATGHRIGTLRDAQYRLLNLLSRITQS